MNKYILSLILGFVIFSDMFCKIALSQNLIESNTYYDSNGRAYFYAEDGKTYYYPEPVAIENNKEGTINSDLQAKFTEIATKYQRAVSTAQNDVQLRLLYKKRTADFNNLNFNGSVIAWNGTLKRMSTMGDSVYIYIEIAPKIEIICNTDIEKSFISNIATAQTGQKVVFSGDLIPNPEDKGFVEESYTTKGSLENPEFRFELKNIDVVNE